LLMDAKKLSQLIREKKKKLLEADPDVVSSEPATMNAQDVEDQKQLGRIETTLDTPPKINADDTMMDMSETDAATAGLTEDEKKRMGRLSSYFDTLDLGW
jgi:hypothetical protein